MINELYNNELWAKEKNDELITCLEKINGIKINVFLGNENEGSNLPSNIDYISIKKTHIDGKEKIKLKKSTINYKKKYDDGRIIEK